LCECCRTKNGRKDEPDADKEKNGKTDGDPYEGKNEDSCTGKTGDQNKGAECADRHTASRSNTEHSGTDCICQAACRNFIINETKTEYGTPPARKRGTGRI